MGIKPYQDRAAPIKANVTREVLLSKEDCIVISQAAGVRLMTTCGTVEEGGH